MTAITEPPADPLRKLAAELYTADDLAGLLQVSRRQIWRMEADGRRPTAGRGADGRPHPLAEAAHRPLAGRQLPAAACHRPLTVP